MSESLTIVFLAVAVLALIVISASLAVTKRKNADLIKKNEGLQRKLKRAKIKIAQWQRGWGTDRQPIFDALGDAFFLVNDKGIITFSNGQADALFQSELEGLHVKECTRIPALLKEVTKAMENEEDSYKEEFSLTSPPKEHGDDEASKETHWVIDVAPVTGQRFYKRVLVKDVTLQHQTDQVRRDFVANASHELRTPMTIILGYLELLQEDGFLKESTEAARKFIKTMFKHGKRIERIVEDMLTISKLESARAVNLKEKDFDLHECVMDVFTRLELLAQEHHTKLATNFKPEHITIYGDRFYWIQIFFNLVENAIKQNPERPITVEVGASINEEHLHMWVKDDGVGIPATHLPFIFKRFYRVETQHTQKIKGTGLGLSIVKRAVEAHQGTMGVTSTPNEETCFSIDLPVSRVH